MRKEFAYFTEGIESGKIMETATIFPWKTQWNSYELPEEGEENPLPSLTEPDQALSLTTLLERHTSGRPLDDYIRPGAFYDFPADVNKSVFDTFQAGVPNLASLDYAERQELLKKTKEYHRILAEEMEAKKKKKAALPASDATPSDNKDKNTPAPSAGNDLPQ